MRIIYSILLCAFYISSLQSQEIVNGLVANFTFDDCIELGKDASGNNAPAIILGNPECVCGVMGNAILLDGEDDFLQILGTVSNTFSTIDFTISMYIKPTNPIGPQDILSKQDACSADRSFSLSFLSSSNSISTTLSQDASRAATVKGALATEPCWYHIVFIRRGNRSQLFIDGTLVDEQQAESRVNIENNAAFSIANGECVGITDRRFAGLIDELRIYERALRVEEVRALNLQPDRIANEDDIIFLGSSIDIELGETCATTFDWIPATGLDNAFIAEPIITPPNEGRFTYTVELTDQFCTATDTIQITVIDPNNLPCEAQLPSAFTPNSDGRNDNYGISNAVILENKLIDFEIFDRWGGRIFTTSDPRAKWDGRFNGKELNPGVFLYRVRYLCNDEEKIDMGSLTLLR